MLLDIKSQVTDLQDILTEVYAEINFGTVQEIRQLDARMAKRLTAIFCALNSFNPPPVPADVFAELGEANRRHALSTYVYDILDELDEAYPGLLDTVHECLREQNKIEEGRA